MPLIRSSSRAASPGVMPRPFSPSGLVATTHSSIRFCATIWSVLPCCGRSRIARIGGAIERMMRLKSADQDARVDKHGLNAIRVNTLAGGGFIAQQGRCAVVAFCPVMKPPRPLLGICALQMRHRLRRNMILSDLRSGERRVGHE